MKQQATQLFPMRINKYLASKRYCTRRDADTLIQQGKVLINGRRAVLGDKVQETDAVEVRYRPRKFRYIAYHKPRGIITHSPQEDETEIIEKVRIPGIFPVGRLDKDSQGLIILTDDGRVTDALLDPKYGHEKEYEVSVQESLPTNFKRRMEGGLDIGGYETKPCTVQMLGAKKFRITLTEGKKHQIRRMCGVFGAAIKDLTRIRVMNVPLGGMGPGEFRDIQGKELEEFLQLLGIPR